MTVNLESHLASQGPFSPQCIKEAQAAWSVYRREYDFKTYRDILTSPTANEKMAKGDNVNYGLALAPARSSVLANVCSHSTPGCRQSCVAYSGNGAYPMVERARDARTAFAVGEPELFGTLVDAEIGMAIHKHHPQQVHVRLNQFSDIRWERHFPWLFDRPAQFYDYTKWPVSQRTNLPTNYHLTFSYSGERPRRMYMRDSNVAVVFDVKKSDPLPETFTLPTELVPRTVVDGDVTDDRYDDATGVIVGLRAKGKARNNKSGFVVSL